MFSRLRLLFVPVIAAVLFCLTSPTAHAQRPALTKSVDETGKDALSSICSFDRYLA
jgi:hypothetical protein